MARLHNRADSDESLPEVTALLTRAKLPQNKQSKVRNSNRQETIKPHRTEERRKPSGSEQRWVQLASTDDNNIKKNVSPGKPRSRLQRPLAKVDGNPLLRPLSGPDPNKATNTSMKSKKQISPINTDPIGQEQSFALPETPKRVDGKKISHTPASDEHFDLQNTLDAYRWDIYDDSLSDFIVNDSASESELRLPPRSQRKSSHVLHRRKARREMRQVLSSDEEVTSEDQDQHCHMKRPGTSQEEIISALHELSLGSSEGTEQEIQLNTVPNQLPYTRTHASDEALPLPKHEPVEQSPPTSLYHPKRTKYPRIATSPALDTSTHLLLPSNTSPTMPSSPRQLCLRDSRIQEVIDEKDQDFSSSLLADPYHSPLVHHISDVEDIAQVPPLKPSCTMPAKKQQLAAKAAKGAFDAEKDDIARSLLSELDMEITGGRLAQLCAHMGGIKILWSTTLQTTAGKAICTVRLHRTGSKDPPTVENSLTIASISSPTKLSTFKPNTGIAYIYHPYKAPTNVAKNQLLLPPEGSTRLSHVTEAKIVLSVKVLTSKERLLKTLSHEFCHLATMALSGEFKSPHGPIWKAWVAKVESRFGDSKGIKISRLHSYEIEYRYAWQCLKCGQEYKRYNKTIKPETQRCGKQNCHGLLEQTKPKPRTKKGGEGGSKVLSPYNVFVQANFEIVKREHPGWAFGQISTELGRRYQIEKQAWNEVGGLVATKKENGSEAQPIVIG